jgi:hypothetical protein
VAWPPFLVLECRPHDSLHDQLRHAPSLLHAVLYLCHVLMVKALCTVSVSGARDACPFIVEARYLAGPDKAHIAQYPALVVRGSSTTPLMHQTGCPGSSLCVHGHSSRGHWVRV